MAVKFCFSLVPLDAKSFSPTPRALDMAITIAFCSQVATLGFAPGFGVSPHTSNASNVFLGIPIHSVGFAGI